MSEIKPILNENKIVLVILLFLILYNLFAGDASLAQTRKLPKAGFPSYSTTPSPSYGVHLTPGINRTQNSPVEYYNPGEPDRNMALVRWEKKSMPLLIWISPGLKLPECPMAELKNTRVDFVTALLQQKDNPFAGITQAPVWTAEVNNQVAAGIEEWRQFENEGLFSFAFTDDPHNAHICVFFTDAFKDASQPGGINIGGNTCAQIYPISLAHSMNIKQKPVVIELSTLVNNTPQKMIGAAAHEFGHALGIKAHSPYREDLMYEDRIVDQLSEADKATIRWLYHQVPQYVM